MEDLLGNYDADPIAALSVALRIVLDMADADWQSLLAATPFDAARRGLLLDGHQASLDDLAKELNEHRGLEPSGG
ncbi:MAG: hypothetical protein QOJ74_1622 [Ilumatobacteraceae bacterium]|nr:hypothetical protein [Ilumatobacteraceae bacterium]